MAKFRVSKAAQNDMRQIGRYTQEQWGIEQRRLYLEGLNKRFTQLSSNPNISPERTDFEPPIRINPYQKHLILYVLGDQGILIVRVLHENMDVPAQLMK